MVFLQGADTVIYERMADAELNLYKEVTRDHLEKFGVDGLWTLCLTYHELDGQLYEAWNEIFSRPSQSYEIGKRNLMR